MTRRRGSRGFSLIELLIGLLIFTTAFLGLLSVYPVSMRALSQARQRMIASHVAEMQLESALNTSFDGLKSSNPTTPSILSMVNGTTEVLSFSTQIVVSDVSDGLKDVRCQVSWSESIPGQTTAMVRYITLETLVANI
jgi:prepilin-type N-terminal cleavage/methylation domain-containing protein